MKKLIILFTFLLINNVLPAPGYKELYIEQPEAIYVFDPMLYSFKFIESTFNADTINKLGYTGILQIGQEMIDEANRICELKNIPMHFTLIDALDERKSTQIWYIVQDFWNPGYELSKACLIWNPLADSRYYERIKNKMRSL